MKHLLMMMAMMIGMAIGAETDKDFVVNCKLISQQELAKALGFPASDSQGFYLVGTIRRDNAPTANIAIRFTGKTVPALRTGWYPLGWANAGEKFFLIPFHNAVPQLMPPDLGTVQFNYEIQLLPEE